MGLFNDIIRDARRPLRGSLIRRNSANASDAAPPVEEHDEPEPMPDTDVQTLFRFQKGKTPASKPGGFQEAPHRSAAAVNRGLSGDPLPAWTEAERPKSHARDVNGNEDISEVRVNRARELETGQVIHGSPGKIAAANVKSETSLSQSRVSSESFESEHYHEKLKSEIPEGSERSVSRDGEALQSRSPGRGASPSETIRHPTASNPDRSAVVERITSTSVLPRSSAPAQPSGSDATISPGANGPPPTLIPGGKVIGLEKQPSRSRREPAFVNLPRPPLEAAPERPPPRDTEIAASGLVIGRIDVVVEAAPTRPQAPTVRTEREFSSRNYLRRL